MQIKSQKDFWSGLMFVAVGVGFAWGATEYSFGNSARPGPGYFPFGLGVLLAILGGMVLFKALTIETHDGDPIGAFAWRPLFIILGSVALFGVLLPRVGMLIALPLLVVLSSLASEEFTWKGALINAVVLTALSWVVFIKGLSLTIPLLPGA
jgi:Tripartite tricarboxylate transporter TctB family